MPDSTSDFLCRRYGKEIANYFSGSPLNRVAFLRGDHKFLWAAFSHPSAAILVVDKELSPLVKDKTTIDYVTAKDVQPLLMTPMLKPFAKPEEMAVEQHNSSEPVEPLILFLGLEETGLPAKDNGFKWKEYSGRPYFALLAAAAKGGADGVIVEQVKKEMVEERGGMWLKDIKSATLGAADASIYALARHLVDWNLCNPFCATCGSRTIPIHAGWKRACPGRDNSKTAASQGRTMRPDCATRLTISNVSFPRTDPTVIAAVVNRAGTAILLGRQRRWPAAMYSTLAGFVEPGESLEEAVRREVWEESGVRVGEVVLHSSQPWPFPAGLMIGALAVAMGGDEEAIHLGHDPELEDAQWFGREEVEEALKERAMTFEDGLVDVGVGKIKLPPKTAIANRLIEQAVVLLDQLNTAKI